jgi:hypothetical protein
MTLDNSTPQTNIFINSFTASGNWEDIAAMVNVGFVGGCSTIKPGPVVVVNIAQGPACNWGNELYPTKVTCTRVMDANNNYLSSNLNINTASEWSLFNIIYAWNYNGQILCSNPFNIELYRPCNNRNYNEPWCMFNLNNNKELVYALSSTPGEIKDVLFKAQTDIYNYFGVRNGILYQVDDT